MATKRQLYKVERHELRGAADQWLIHNRPEVRSKLTKRLLAETLIYLRGYAKAMNYFARDPIIIDEMRDLMIGEGIEYIDSNIE